MSENRNLCDLLYRQVHPSYVPNGHPSSQAFNPTPKDGRMLSVDDATIVNAEESWVHFTADLGFSSAGTWAVSVEEIAALTDLKLLGDPIAGNPAHCLIDFNGVESKGQVKKRAQTLAIKATARGCQFLAP